MARRNLYEVIAADYRRLIEEGVLKPGDPMPLIKEIQEDRGTTYTTVRDAFRLLETEGLLAKSGTARNAGWSVTAPAAAIPFHARPATAPMDGWTRGVEATGRAAVLRTEVVIPRPGDVPPRVRALLQLETGEMATVRREIGFLEDLPTVLSLTYVRKSDADSTDLGFPEPVDLKAEFARLKTPVTQVSEAATARTPTHTEANDLRIPPAEPVQELLRTYSTGDRPLAVTVLVYPGALYTRTYDIPTD